MTPDKVQLTEVCDALATVVVDVEHHISTM